MALQKISKHVVQDNTLTGDQIGTIGNFTSTGIDDNATSTAITIDSSENVGISETTPLGKLHVKTADSGISSVSGGANEFVIEGSGDTGMCIVGGTSSSAQILFGDSGSSFRGAINYDNGSDSLIISTSASERMRIDSSGNVGIGTNSPARALDVHQDYDSGIMFDFQNTSTGGNPFGGRIYFPYSSPDARNEYFLSCRDSTAERCKIWSDGDIQNHDGTYGTLSDQRIKQDITNANSQWNDIKALQFKNFKKKDDVAQYGADNAPTHLGVIAQELEQTSPGLVGEYACSETDASLHSDFIDWENATVKGVKYSILYMKAVKALQEAMEKIETLETQRADLEARITALENA
jgi:hypothetical protein